jgi:hypothetical protein
MVKTDVIAKKWRTLLQDPEIARHWDEMQVRDADIELFRWGHSRSLTTSLLYSSDILQLRFFIVSIYHKEQLNGIIRSSSYAA